MHVNVVIYVRVSTADQESGRDTQIDVINKKISSVGYRHVLETFIDEDVSGDSHVEERPAFRKMLEYIRTHNSQHPEDPIREVWVQTRDRIAREVDMLGYASVVLRSVGVEIRATEESEELLVTRIYDLLGEEELKKYKQKRMYGIKRRIQEQKIMSRPPFGYKIQNGKLVVDEEVRPKLVEIFQMFEDNVTMSTISNKYNIPRSTLAYLRKNPIYRTGEYYWKGKVVYRVDSIIKEGDVKIRDEDDFYS
ncbi:MAG: recombinase family protein [Candidatus Heimdallarchaeaceae archaeon]